MYNVNYESTLMRIARDVILEESGKIEASQYWTNRTEVGQKMNAALQIAYAKAFTNCTDFQLLVVDLADSFEEKIVTTQVQIQKKQIREYEQEATMIRSGTSVLYSEADLTIARINAKASSESYIIVNEANAQALNNTISYESQAYAKAASELGLTSNEVLEYMYYTNLDKQGKATLVVGLENSILNIGKALP